jgi:hypothetical protein
VTLEHDPEKHALGRDPRVGTGFPKKIMLNQSTRARSLLIESQTRSHFLI